MMLSLGSKRKSKQHAPSVSGVIVLLYHHPLAPELERYLRFNDVGQTYIAESLCWHAAVKLNIKPIAFHLFALYCSESKQWLASNDPVSVKDSKTQYFEFRIRLKVSAHWVRLLPSIDRATLDYLYLQCKNDLINKEHLNADILDDSEQWAKKCVGLGLIDATCALFQCHKGPNELNKYFTVKDFLPSECIKVYSSPIQKTRLYVNFKDNVEKKYNEHQKLSPDGDLTKLMIQYILGGIFEYFPQYLVEIFTTVDGTKLVVDPQQGTEAGIFNQSTQKMISSICDIMEIHIVEGNQGSITVRINRKAGRPELLYFTTIEQARSFTSLLDKYYRMMVDYHVHVCKSVTSDLVTWMDKVKCHGPVTGKWAINRLKSYNEEHQQFACNYLLKQVNRSSSEKLGHKWSLELVILSPKSREQIYIEWDYNSQVRNMWDCACALSVADEPKFMSLEELVRHYTTNPTAVVHLQRCLRSSQSKPVEERLLVCQRSDESQSSSVSPSHVLPQSRVPAIIQDVKIRQKNIADGKFTEVHRGTLPAYTNEEVAIKQLKRESTSLLEMFTGSVHKTCFWSDSNLVHIRGICMMGPFSLIQEYAALGNLSRYLCNPKEPIKVLHLVIVARQIASALFYLYEKEDYHGNVRCKNILVFHHNHGGMTVKLADPGLLFFYNSQPLENEVNTERLPWIAPELFRDLERMSNATDMYAFGMTLWEMFSSGLKPHFNKSDREVRETAEKGIFLDQPPQCPKPVYDLMKECWRPDPADRINSRRALRNMNSVEMNADDREYARPEWESEAQCQEVIENRLNSAQIKCNNKQFLQQEMPLGEWQMVTVSETRQSRPLPHTPRFTDPLLIQEDQLVISNMLGQGYYGQVFLASYDKDGDSIQVAVKSLNSDMYEKCATEFEAEMKIMARLTHNNIVSVIGKCPQRSSESPMLIVMEFVENGCLRDFLQTQKDVVRQNDLILFAIDVAAGMTYLSGEKIIHNDLAARNVLVTNDYPRRAKISDFGLAKLLPPEQYYYKQLPGKAIPAFWCAPEAIQFQKLSHKSDVWSYGVTLWEIYSLGKSPHLCKEPSELIGNLHRGTRLSTKTLDCPEGIPVLMKNCWEFKSEDRPYFTEIYDKLTHIRMSVNI